MAVVVPESVCLFSFWHSRHPHHLFRDCETVRLKKTLFQHMDEVAKSTSANERVMKFGLIEKELMYHVLFFLFFFRLFCCSSRISLLERGA